MGTQMWVGIVSLLASCFKILINFGHTCAYTCICASAVEGGVYRFSECERIDTDSIQEWEAFKDIGVEHCSPSTCVYAVLVWPARPTPPLLFINYARFYCGL